MYMYLSTLLFKKWIYQINTIQWTLWGWLLEYGYSYSLSSITRNFNLVYLSTYVITITAVDKPIITISKQIIILWNMTGPGTFLDSFSSFSIFIKTIIMI